MNFKFFTVSDKEDVLETLLSVLGKTIEWINIEDSIIRILFSDNNMIELYDRKQVCCEKRYMRTDDDLSDFIGASIIDFELKTAEANHVGEDNVREIQFLDIITDKGVLQICNHNDHNGYYSGFEIDVKSSFKFLS